MRKTILLLAIFLGSIGSLMASPVSLNRAVKVAASIGKNFLGIDNAQWTVHPDDYEHIYAVAAPGRGFVLVAKDDCVQPVIGFSASEYTLDDAPVNARGWLSLRDEEIGLCLSLGLQADADITAEWLRLEEGSPLPTGSSLSPLLTTQWAQSGFYNRMCPQSGSQYAMVGCAATAMAQVMKYWNFPTTGYSSHTDYYSNIAGSNPYANFGATTYDWDNMPNKVNTYCTQTQKDAVALLCFHCGVAIDMQYGLSESMAYMSDIPYAMRYYFNYSTSISQIQKSSYSNSSWISTIQAQLNAGKPVLYRGANSSNNNGHIFVCDGYNSSDYFHFNWGWGGSYDGYFSVSSLNPGSNQYSSYQYAVINIAPSTSFRVSPNTKSIQANGGSFTFSVYSSSSWTASSNRSWVTLSQSSGSGAKTDVVATVAGNPTTSSRTATVTITQGSSTRNVTITQSGDTTTVQSIPFYQGFENGIPACWSEICEEGNHHWSTLSGGTNSSPSLAHSGNYNANFSHQETNSVTKLLTPKIDLSLASLPYLTFYYANEQWSGSQNVLRVYGRSTPSVGWSLLGFYSSSVANWTKVTLPIPASTANYQIAFEGVDNWGHDVVIDDVFVFDSAATGDGSSQIITVQIGNGTTSSYNGPYNNYFMQSWNECRYGGSEIGITGNITKIAYNCTSNNSLSASVSVYMGMVANDHFLSSSDWTPLSQLTQVYSRTSTTIGSSLGWEELVLDTPFSFTDTSQSLAVVVVKSAESYTNTLLYGATSCTNMCLYRQTDNNPDYISHPGVNTGTLASLRPNIRMTIDHQEITHDTLYIHDTTFVNVYVHDTTYVPVHDTTYVDVFIHDTTYVPVHDTTFVNVYVHDTTYVNVYVHDTTYVDVFIHDTTYIDVILHDTTFITQPLSYYTLTVTSSDLGLGVVAGNGTYSEGTLVEMAAIPTEGTRFLQWQDGSSENPRTVEMTADRSFTALFETIPVGVTEVATTSHTIRVRGTQIIVDNAENELVRIFDELGRCLSTTRDAQTTRIFNMPSSGVYLVQVGSASAHKVVVVK